MRSAFSKNSASDSASRRERNDGAERGRRRLRVGTVTCSDMAGAAKDRVRGAEAPLQL